MNRHLSTTIALVLVLCSLSVSTRADIKDLHRTRTVDKSGFADRTTIQAAIDSITPPVNEKWTVLVYAGTYDEAVTLDPNHPNIDIVGVDPDAVIIAPPANTDAITIQGNGARNNTIRSLTIAVNDPNDSWTEKGRGVVVREHTAGGNPSAIRIENVRIRTRVDNSELGAAGHGILLESAPDDVEVINCTITTHRSNGRAISVQPASNPDTDPVRNLRVHGTRLIASGDGNSNFAIYVAHPVESMTVSASFIGMEGSSAAGGAGIQFVASSAGSRGLNLDGLVVRSIRAGTPLWLEQATDIRINNCDILDVDAGAGIRLGNQATVTHSTVVIDRSFGPYRIGHDDSGAIRAVGKSGLRISNCLLRGRLAGLWLEQNCTDVVVTDCTLTGTFSGAQIECGDNISFTNCRLLADERLRRRDDPDPPPVLPEQYAGLWIDDREADPACEPGRIELVACDLRALNEQDTDRSVFGVLASAAPTAAAGPARLSDCTIDARLLDAASNGRCFGAAALEAAALALVGGAVTSSDADEREPNQFDVFNNVPLFPSTAIAVSGTRFSRWRGPIGPAVQASSLVQRVVNVAAAADDAVLAATALTASEQEITTGITNPDVYRVLSVRGNQPIMNQTVIVIGTNLAGESIADAISLVGTTIASGVKPFQSVRKIILPPQSGPGQQVSVGTTTWLGLRIAFSSTTDLQQQARKAADADMYTVEEAGSPNPTWSTLDVGPITDGDSFEFTLLASR